MIDNKKIDDAAYRFATSQEHGELLALIDGYKEGYKDAINEFLKDLWHPASEEPRKDVSIMVETHNDENMFYYAWNRWRDNFYPSWTDAVLCSRVSRWLYIDDLLPKEGGGEQ